MTIEYKAVSFRRINATVVEQQLNELAAQGWRVCATLPGAMATGIVIMEKDSPSD